MIDNIAVGKTIARLRQSKNMTQQQLAAALSVSHQAVSKWETGAALPDVQTLMALTGLFGVTVEQLLNCEVPEDRLGGRTAPSLDESIQSIGSFVNNIVSGIFRSEKKEADAGGSVGETTETGTEAADDGSPRDAPECEQEAEESGETEEPKETEAAEQPEFDVKRLIQMAPFMSKPAVDALLMENRARLSAEDIAQLAPFVSQDCLVKLIQNTDSEIGWDTLRRVAPFLKREMVDKLARAAAEGGRFVRKTAAQAGINTDDVGRTFEDVSQKIGSGMEKAFRAAARLGEDVCSEVTNAVNGIVDGIKANQSRADSLRRAALERALQDENWDWLASRIGDIKDEELLRRIAQKANELGMHDWVLEHLNGYADTRTIDAAIESDDWAWLGDHVWQFEDELQEKIARAAAKAENWQWLATYAEQISMENCGAEIAIAAYEAGARVLARELAENSMSEAQREALADAAIRAEDYDFLNDIADLLDSGYFGRLCLARAQEKNWEKAGEYAPRADRRSIEQMMELAIAEGNFDAIDMLDPYL